MLNEWLLRQLSDNVVSRHVDVSIEDLIVYLATMLFCVQHFLPHSSLQNTAGAPKLEDVR